MAVFWQLQQTTSSLRDPHEPVAGRYYYPAHPRTLILQQRSFGHSARMSREREQRRSLPAADRHLEGRGRRESRHGNVAGLAGRALENRRPQASRARFTRRYRRLLRAPARRQASRGGTGSEAARYRLEDHAARFRGRKPDRKHRPLAVAQSCGARAHQPAAQGEHRMARHGEAMQGRPSGGLQRRLGCRRAVRERALVHDRRNDVLVGGRAPVERIQRVHVRPAHRPRGRLDYDSAHQRPHCRSRRAARSQSARSSGCVRAACGDGGHRGLSERGRRERRL